VQYIQDAGIRQSIISGREKDSLSKNITQGM